MLYNRKKRYVTFFKDRLSIISSFCWEARNYGIPDLYAKREIISLGHTYAPYRLYRCKASFSEEKGGCFSFPLSEFLSHSFVSLHLEVVIWCTIVSMDTVAWCTRVPEDTLRQVRPFVVHYMHRAVRISSPIYINNTIIAVKDRS